MTVDTTVATQFAHARRRFLLVGAWIPAVMVIIAVALQVMWLPELPDPVATHYSGAGPDGFGAAITYPLMTAGVGILIIGISVLAVVLPASSGWGATARLMGGFLPAVLIMILVGLGYSVASQRGLADATQAPDPGLALLVGLGIGAIYAVIAWFLQPSLTIAPADLREARARPIAAGERAAWMRTLRVQGGGMWILALSSLMLIGIAIAMTVTGEPSATWLWILTAFVLVLVVTMFVFRVRIDHRGFLARSVVGVPFFRVPLNEIAHVRTMTVNPVGDFGGWGLRYAPGMGLGIIMRSGPALQIERTNGKKLTITVDDAERAADTLLGLRDSHTS